MNIFRHNIVGNEIIINQADWTYLKSSYKEEYLIQQFSDAIEEFKIKLPYKKVSFQDMVDDYNRLKELDGTTLIKKGKWVSKFPYKYAFLDQYIDNSNVGLDASNYFHQVERWKCDATGYPSPAKTWSTEKFRLTLFKALFSLKLKEINPDKLRNCITLRKYIASQFRPAAAKAIYDHFKASHVLDFSMGWGDRLAAAHASKYVQKYIGFDPNLSLNKGYFDQIGEYNKLNIPDRGGMRFFTPIPACAEDESLVFLQDKYDLIFTSPPYFDKEKYDQSKFQSYVKYKKFDVWMKEFLYKTIDLRCKNLISGGHLVINISDIYTRKKLYPICDLMNDYITSTGLFEYVGAMGLRMPKRPMSKSSNSEGIYGEPIWIWKKK